MTTQLNACACQTCTGPQCTCGCQTPESRPTSSRRCAEACTCDEACTCGETCNCKGCMDANSRLVESR
jgi:hypothetical protein